RAARRLVRAAPAQDNDRQSAANLSASRRDAARGCDMSEKQTPGLVDCDIHPTVTAMADLNPYLTDRWKLYMREYGANFRQVFASAGRYPRYNRDGGARLDARPPSGVLQPLRPNGIGARNQAFGESLTAAVNDWQADAWLGEEGRLKGSLMLTRED